MSTATENVEVAVYQKAKRGNSCCGDSYFYDEIDNQFICALADGLGSGEYAQESAETVIEVVKNNSHLSKNELAKLCTKRLAGQRGVVLGILIFDYETEIFKFLSIGNVGLRTITSDKVKNRNIPNQGYLGGYQHDFKVMRAKLEPNMKFILFTDGVSDNELAVDYFLFSNVNQIIRTYQNLVVEPREDDTTLIAINYIGK